MRLIDADALIDDIDGDLTDSIAEGKAIEKIMNAPTIDALPVKHGKWVTDTDGRLHCSNCTNIPINRILFRGSLVYEIDISKQMKFCPKCGAKME